MSTRDIFWAVVGAAMIFVAAALFTRAFALDRNTNAYRAAYAYQIATRCGLTIPPDMVEGLKLLMRGEYGGELLAVAATIRTDANMDFDNGDDAFRKRICALAREQLNR